MGFDFGMLDLDNLLLWQGDPNGDTWLSRQADAVKTFAENINITQSWIREDYQEMAEPVACWQGRGRQGAVPPLPQRA
jgi:hypothetical protein